MDTPLFDSFGGPTVGYCSQCGEARDSFYICRDGGVTQLPDADSVRIVVTGGRDFADETRVRSVLSKVATLATAVTLVHGAARGADTLAAKVGGKLGFTLEPHPADWDTHGPAAGPIRNAEMISLGADLVIAFPSNGPGTADCKRRAVRAGIPVLDVGR